MQLYLLIKSKTEVYMKSITKSRTVFALSAILLLALVSCSSGVDLEDGLYFAQQTEYASSGWKYNLTIVVENGKMTDVSWNGSNRMGGPDKVAVSEAGNYPMVANGGAMADWHVQAEAVEEYFIDNPETTMPDAISGATIHFNEFYELAEEALANGPVGMGPYRDGEYRAMDSDFHNGWKYYVDITVTSGYVVTAHWDAVAEDGGTDKAQRSMDGEYGMVANGGAMAEWHEQALAVEAAFLESQSTDAPDALSTATITYDGFYSLAEQALAGARK
jgi:major membrane immunogen (membrane-anchored lipoprotein)